jgi:flagellar capping protein FliD
MITINIDKAKNIAHEKRRAARTAEFAPLDIKATIPSEATVAEADRQIIRDKYAEIQTAINAAETVDGIKTEMNKFLDKLNGI